LTLCFILVNVELPKWVLFKEIKMNEMEQELDDLLDRLDKVLTENDMALLRYACGKSKTSSDKLRDLFIDIGNIFGENKK
jgi:succinate dehydrogenase flavin-adding protein (antitoxin of CptAB toxin-antitoxin module)